MFQILLKEVHKVGNISKTSITKAGLGDFCVSLTLVMFIFLKSILTIPTLVWFIFTRYVFSYSLTSNPSIYLKWFV